MEETPLRIVHFRIQALYPPTVPRFSGSALQELYLKISERHQFEKFELIGDQGAKLSTEAIRDCEIRRDRIILWENVQRTFELVTKDFTDIIEIVHGKLSVPVLVGFSCILRALWPLPTEMDAGSFLRSQALNISDDQFQLLGVPKIAGVGLRINCPDLAHHKIHDFKIEPFFKDAKNLFIELASSFPEPIQTVPICEQRMKECYDFLMNKIISFVKSFGSEGIS